MDTEQLILEKRGPIMYRYIQDIEKQAGKAYVETCEAADELERLIRTGNLAPAIIFRIGTIKRKLEVAKVHWENVDQDTNAVFQDVQDAREGKPVVWPEMTELEGRN